MKIGQSAGKDFAYILGVYLGDGCVTKQQGYFVFRLNTIDLDFAEATKTALSKLTNYKISIYTHPVSKSTKPNHALRCGDQQLAQNLQQITNNKQRIPSCIFLFDKEIQKQFIIGLMDSEGFVANTNNRYYMGFKSCDIWVPTFIRLLEVVGIQIGKVSQEKPYKDWYKTPTRFAIKMRSWVLQEMYFNISRKQSRVNAWAKVNLND